jgi:hypothetical protein
MSEGVYLHLFHGRDTPEQELEDWGKEGPCLGPLSSVHGTYLSTMQVTVGDCGMSFVTYYEDLIVYDGVFYGDFVVLPEPRPGVLPEQWDDAKAELPEEYRPKPKPDEEEIFQCDNCSFIYSDLSERIKCTHLEGMFFCKECMREAGVPEDEWGKTTAKVDGRKFDDTETDENNPDISRIKENR